MNIQKQQITGREFNVDTIISVMNQLQKAWDGALDHSFNNPQCADASLAITCLKMAFLKDCGFNPTQISAIMAELRFTEGKREFLAKIIETK